MTGKLFKKAILQTVQRNTEEENLLHGSQFGFCACHSTTFQYVRLADQVTQNFNDNISMAVVFLNIKKAFDNTWHHGLLYKLSKFHFLASIIKLIRSFLYNRKFRGTVEGKISMPWEIQTRVPQGSILAPNLYSLCINNTPTNSRGPPKPLC
jgi:hypothetical protein